REHGEDLVLIVPGLGAEHAELLRVDDRKEREEMRRLHRADFQRGLLLAHGLELAACEAELHVERRDVELVAAVGPADRANRDVAFVVQTLGELGQRFGGLRSEVLFAFAGLTDAEDVALLSCIVGEDDVEARRVAAATRLWNDEALLRRRPADA